MSVEFRHTGFQYEPTRPVLIDVSFNVEPGEFLLVVGQNGVGKSTLLKLMNGILKPTAGEVFVNALKTSDHRTSRLAKEICVTFQNPADQIFATTVRAEIAFGPDNLGREDSDKLVEEALALFEFQSHATQHPYDLPPAQRKLLTVASAFASGAPFLAFDEPSAGLSRLERSVFERVLSALKKSGRGLIVVSHDLDLLLPYATKTLILAKGEMVYYGETSEVFKQRNLLRKAGLRLPVAHRLREILELR